jgi:hypothetical protein
MTLQPETAVTVDALARMLSAADVEINHGDYPTWDTLAESGQKQYRLAARYLLKRLHITAPAAVSAAVAPPTQTALRDRIAEALMQWAEGNNSPKYTSMRRPETVVQNAYSRADAVLAVLPEVADRDAVLREAADQYAKLTDQNEAYDREHGELDEDARLRHEVVRDVVAGLRRMADATATQTHAERRDHFARVIYERWNPGHRWADAHPDDVIAYGTDADFAMAAADTVAGTSYSPPTHVDVYREVADRLAALGTKSSCLWARPAARQVREWADETATETPAAVDLPTLAAALDGLHTLIATSSRDWQTYRVDAWLWAVLCGWDCEQTEHDDTCVHGALEETASMHGWDEATVAKARRYRAAVLAVTEHQPAAGARQDGAES